MNSSLFGEENVHVYVLYYKRIITIDWTCKYSSIYGIFYLKIDEFGITWYFWRLIYTFLKNIFCYTFYGIISTLLQIKGLENVYLISLATNLYKVFNILVCSIMIRYSYSDYINWLVSYIISIINFVNINHYLQEYF